jgi:hypothetical protein
MTFWYIQNEAFDNRYLLSVIRSSIKLISIVAKYYFLLINHEYRKK